MRWTRERVAALNPDAMFADGFDAAISGTSLRAGRTVARYSIPRCIRVLAKDGMTAEEAGEFLDFNVIGAYVGPNTPVFRSR